MITKYSMKIKDIITEERLADFYSDADRQCINEAATIFARDCSPFFTEHQTGQPLYRGVTNNVVRINPYLFKVATEANRNPLDTPTINHNLADKWLNDNVGGRFRSDHIAFCTGRQTTASAYGTVHIIVPIGDFSFCWSPLIRDMSNVLPKTGAVSAAAALNDQLSDEEIRTGMVEHVLARGRYQTTQLTSAIASLNEIMLRCNQYYALRCGFEFYNAIIEEMQAIT